MEFRRLYRSSISLIAGCIVFAACGTRSEVTPPVERHSADSMQLLSKNFAKLGSDISFGEEDLMYLDYGNYSLVDTAQVHQLGLPVQDGQTYYRVGRLDLAFGYIGLVLLANQIDSNHQVRDQFICRIYDSLASYKGKVILAEVWLHEQLERMTGTLSDGKSLTTTRTIFHFTDGEYVEATADSLRESFRYEIDQNGKVMTLMQNRTDS